MTAMDKGCSESAGTLVEPFFASTVLLSSTFTHSFPNAKDADPNAMRQYLVLAKPSLYIAANVCNTVTPTFSNAM